MTTWIGIFAGTLTAISLLPQLIKILREKKPGDFSILMFLILLAGLALWIWYGILKKDWPIIITNCTSMLINIGILSSNLWYKTKTQR